MTLFPHQFATDGNAQNSLVFREFKKKQMGRSPCGHDQAMLQQHCMYHHYDNAIPASLVVHFWTKTRACSSVDQSPSPQKLSSRFRSCTVVPDLPTASLHVHMCQLHYGGHDTIFRNDHPFKRLKRHCNDMATYYRQSQQAHAVQNAMIRAN